MTDSVSVSNARCDWRVFGEENVDLRRNENERASASLNEHECEDEDASKVIRVADHCDVEKSYHSHKRPPGTRAGHAWGNVVLVDNPYNPDSPRHQSER